MHVIACAHAGMFDAASGRMRVTTILASVALAATTMVTAHAEVDTRVPFGDRLDHYRPRRDSDWVPLASPTPTRFGTEYIVVGRDVGWFRTIRIEAVSGSVYVKTLTMTSGRYTKVFPVNVYLDARRPVAYVDLGTRWLIDQIAITTRRYPAGAYTVAGSSGVPGRPRYVAER